MTSKLKKIITSKFFRKILIIILLVLFILQLIIGSIAYYCIFNTKINWDNFCKNFSYLSSFVSNPNTPVGEQLNVDKKTSKEIDKIEEILKKAHNDELRRIQDIKYWLKNIRNNIKQVKIKSFDKLSLNGNIIINDTVKNNKNWIILAFGYGDNGYSIFNIAFAKIFSDLGFNVLIIDQRGYGLSDGEYTSLGYKESEDIKQWINYLVEKYPDCQIATWGISMGATSVLLACGCKLPENFKLCIADCPFDSFYGLLKYLSGHMMNVPSILSSYILNGMSTIAWLRHGINIKFSTKNYLEKANVPILFFHGTNDTYVPYSTSKDMYDSYKNYKEVILTKYAGHCASSTLDYDGYVKAIKNFTRKFMNFSEFDNLQDNIIYSGDKF